MTTSSIGRHMSLAVNDTTSVKFFTLYRKDDKMKYAETNRFEECAITPSEEAYDNLLTVCGHDKAIGSEPKEISS